MNKITYPNDGSIQNVLYRVYGCLLKGIFHSNQAQSFKFILKYFTIIKRMNTFSPNLLCILLKREIDIQFCQEKHARELNFLGASWYMTLLYAPCQGLSLEVGGPPTPIPTEVAAPAPVAPRCTRHLAHPGQEESGQALVTQPQLMWSGLSCAFFLSRIQLQFIACCGDILQIKYLLINSLTLYLLALIITNKEYNVYEHKRHDR